MNWHIFHISPLNACVPCVVRKRLCGEGGQLSEEQLAFPHGIESGWRKLSESESQRVFHMLVWHTTHMPGMEIPIPSEGKREGNRRALIGTLCPQEKWEPGVEA